MATTTKFLAGLTLLTVLLSACTQPATTTLAPDKATATVAQSTPVATSPTNTTMPTELPAATPTLEPTPDSATATPASTAPLTGLGVTRVDVARGWQLLQFEFTEQGDRYIGTISDNLATVEFAGPAADITSASLEINMPKPPTEKQSARCMVYLAGLLSSATPNWEGGKDWLTTNLDKTGESRTTYDNRDVILVVTPGDSSTLAKPTIKAR